MRALISHLCYCLIKFISFLWSLFTHLCSAIWYFIHVRSWTINTSLVYILSECSWDDIYEWLIKLHRKIVDFGWSELYDCASIVWNTLAIYGGNDFIEFARLIGAMIEGWLPIMPARLTSIIHHYNEKFANFINGLIWPIIRDFINFLKLLTAMVQREQELGDAWQHIVDYINGMDSNVIMGLAILLLIYNIYKMRYYAALTTYKKYYKEHPQELPHDHEARHQHWLKYKQEYYKRRRQDTWWWW